jgi:hypothetical protein
MEDIITVETDAFSEQEARKVFAHLCKHVIQRKPGEVKRKILYIKSGESITWSHVLELLTRYGLKSSLSFEYDKNKKATALTVKEIDHLRLKKGLSALPQAVVHKMDSLNP